MSVSHRLLTAAIRALALFAGLNLLLGLVLPGFDANWLWVSGGVAPLARDLALAGFALSVLLGRRVHPRVAFLFAMAVAALCVADAIGYYRLVYSGSIRTAFPLPLSVLLAALLGAWAVLELGARRRASPASRRTLWHKVAEGGRTAVT